MITGKSKKKAVLISYITIGIQFLTTFVVTPFILKSIGSSEYGLYELVYSTVSNLSLLGFGFAASYIRFFSRYSESNDMESIHKLNGLFMSMFLAMSVLCIIIGTVLIFNIKSIFSTGLSAAEYDRARILMAILVLNMALTFPKSIFISNVAAHEQFVFQKGLVFLCAILQPVLQIIFVISNSGALGLGLAVLLVSLLDFLIYLVFNFRFLHIQFSFGGLDCVLLKEITQFTFFIFLNQLLDALLGSNVDNILIGRFCGTNEITIYSMGGKFNSIFYSLSTPISSVFVPQINRLVAKGESDDDLTRIFVRVGRYQWMILLLLFSGFCIWGRFFIRLWIGEGYDRSFYIGLLLISSVLVSLTQNIGIEIQRAKNRHQVRSVVYLAIAIGNVLLTIPLVQILGAIGAAIGTAIALILGTVLFMNWYYSKKLNIKVMEYWKTTISFGIKMLPCIVIGGVITRIFKPINIVTMMIEVIIYFVLYIASLYCFILTSEERSFLQNLLKRHI